MIITWCKIVPFKINITFNKFPILLLLVIGSITTYHISEQKNFVENAEYTAGVVTEISVEEHARGKSYFPIVEFVARNGKSHTFKSNIVSQQYNVGDEISVRYLEGDVGNAVIWHHAAVWSRAYFLSFLTALCFLISFNLSFSRKRKS